MAEGWTRTLKNDDFEAFSAGTAPHGVDPLAVAVMSEAGVDISRQKSTHVDEYRSMFFDYVVTVCDNARENCPYFPAKVKIMHKSFNDPPVLAKNASTKEEALTHYRRVRDEIKKYVEKL